MDDLAAAHVLGLEHQLAGGQAPCRLWWQMLKNKHLSFIPPRYAAF
ncbi:hypothetical protein [Neomoorella thermoacetica]